MTVNVFDLEHRVCRAQVAHLHRPSAGAGLRHWSTSWPARPPMRLSRQFQIHGNPRRLSLASLRIAL